MKMIHTKLLSLIVLIHPLFSIAQEHSFTNYKEGLAGTTVYCMQQDKEGFLWFGTETGLSRFDGTTFKNFTTTHGLPDNEILRLFVDSKNRVWIIPFKSSVCYYWKGKIYNEDNDTVLAKIAVRSRVRTVSEDRYGNILIFELEGFSIIRPGGKVDTIRTYNHQPFTGIEAGLNEKGTFRLVISSHDAEVTFLDLDNNETQILKRDNRLFTEDLLRDYMFLPGLEIVRRPDSLLFFRSKQNEIFGLPVPKNFTNMCRLNDSLFVINAASRCIIYNLNRKKIHEEFLVGHTVAAILEDKEKSLWFATLGQGVFRLRSTEFKNIRFIDNKSPHSVFSIHKLGSLIYIGSNNSILWNFNPNTGIIGKQRLQHTNQNARVLCIVTGNKKNLLVGTDWGIYKILDTTMSILIPLAIKSILFYENKLLVASATCAFIVTEKERNHWEEKVVWKTRSTCAFPYDSGFYIGTLNGLYEVNEKKEAFFLGEKNKLLSNRISAIAKAGHDTYWIATYGEGIIGLRKGKMIMHITQDKGLSSNICRNIFVSGNDLWVGTDKGLNKISLEDDLFTITKFTTADGLSSDIINAVYVDSGIVYAGTPEGITYFNESRVSHTSDCVLRITGINISDRVWNFDTTGFVLPHKDNNIYFEFAGISYKSAGDITYRYRLIGLDSNWRITPQSFLSYPSLPSGKYELQLAAINKFGVQSNTKYVSFTIEELLVEKTWFRLSALLGAGVLCWLIIRFYVRRIRKKDAEKANTLQRLTELEQMALKAQMNPHFIFNSLNSIQQYVVDKDTKGANKFITGFSRLIRQTLDFSTKQEISLSEDMEYLATYLELEKIRTENKFTYEIHIDDTIATNEYRIPPMILQPYVENSIRHGIGYRKDKLGKIFISVTRQKDRLVCMIEDNGVGRMLADQFKKKERINQEAKGMALTAARIEMYNSNNNKYKIRLTIHDRKDEKGDPSGTSVVISFPFHINRFV